MMLASTPIAGTVIRIGIDPVAVMVGSGVGVAGAGGDDGGADVVNCSVGVWMMASAAFGDGAVSRSTPSNQPRSVRRRARAAARTLRRCLPERGAAAGEVSRPVAPTSAERRAPSESDHPGPLRFGLPRVGQGLPSFDESAPVRPGRSSSPGRLKKSSGSVPPGSSIVGQRQSSCATSPPTICTLSAGWPSSPHTVYSPAGRPG